MINEKIQGSNPHFHSGERQVQQRVGVEGSESLGRRNISQHMPMQHREFYQQQSLLFIGAQDKQQRPWASVIVGQEGFIRTPTDKKMVISGLPFSGEPIRDGLNEQAAVGVLGLDFNSRRRNRMNGRVTSCGSTTGAEVEQTISIAVDQAFGNCPKYIQSRVRLSDGNTTGEHRHNPEVLRSNQFTDEHRRLIESADTFFIVTQHEVKNKSGQYSMDVSHRGGKPGFVKFVDNDTIQWPDFMGNFYFNTLGNLEEDSRAGLLFLDFTTGDLLSVTGQAEVIWDGAGLGGGADTSGYRGAERFVRFTLDEVVHIPKAYPLDWSAVSVSPFLETTDSWAEFEARRANELTANRFQPYRVARVENEAEGIRSFYLEAENGHKLPEFKAGQFLPVKMTNAEGESLFRSYSLSGAPTDPQYRISVKRILGENPGIVSNSLHEQIKPGSRLEVMVPRGDFVLSENQGPIVLLSAGVGITPMISMLQSVMEANARTGQQRKVYFIHGTQNAQHHAFRNLVDSMAKTMPWLKVAYVYSQSTDEDGVKTTINEKLNTGLQTPTRYFSGRINKHVLQKMLPIDDYEFYLCGPSAFMKSSYKILQELNVYPEGIHYEFFGPGTLVEDVAAQQNDTKTSAEPVVVKFARSQKEAIWQPASGTLLELAEAAGVDPAYGCRNGQCNGCSTKIHQGKVHQSKGKQPAHGESTLICCATPESLHEVEFKDQALVLDL